MIYGQIFVSLKLSVYKDLDRLLLKVSLSSEFLPVNSRLPYSGKLSQLNPPFAPTIEEVAF